MSKRLATRTRGRGWVGGAGFCVALVVLDDAAAYISFSVFKAIVNPPLEVVPVDVVPVVPVDVVPLDVVPVEVVPVVPVEVVPLDVVPVLVVPVVPVEVVPLEVVPVEVVPVVPVVPVLPLDVEPAQPNKQHKNKRQPLLNRPPKSAGRQPCCLHPARMKAIIARKRRMCRFEQANLSQHVETVGDPNSGAGVGGGGGVLCGAGCAG